jgi:glyoxylase-like metal-dependent hydrolase (beta-lactamase superfamily II)
MIATHGHFDHIMAAGEIQLSFNVPLFINEKDLFLVKRLKETARHFLEYEPYVIDPINIQSLPENEFQILNFKCQIIDAAGHTPGSIAIYFENDQVLFTGDTIFKQAIGRYDFAHSDKYKLLNSIKKLFELPENTAIYSGHGEETSIMEEKINIL